MAKTKQSNLIASVKMLNIDVINKDTINLGVGGGGGYSVLVNYQTFLSNFFSLAHSNLFFLVNCRRNKLLHVSFIEQYDFTIYQHLNKRTKILPLVTSQILIYATSLFMFALPISMPRFKTIIFLSK